MTIQNEKDLFNAFVDKVMEGEALKEDIKILKDEAKKVGITKEAIPLVMKSAKAYVKAAFDEEVAGFEAFQAKYEELTKSA